MNLKSFDEFTNEKNDLNLVIFLEAILNVLSTLYP